MNSIITITLLRNEIMYDIELIAYSVGDTVKGMDEKERSLVMDVGDDGKVDKTTQGINKAWGELLNSITGYTKIETNEDLNVDNSFIIPNEYSVRLCVPYSFSKLNAEAVKNSMHAYLVNKALSGWFAITKKDEVSYYESESLIELAKVKKFLNVRVNPVRIKMHPF
ncbi:hypothetical protein [Bacteroides sp.]|uniref:hypothetical protein n=1 Tax=Bacteroides sp. TaxID=29523 RepID=UPI00262A244D|nr:hypothetical protein [Bacteroides sp.]MDD3037140.1 hypothetical protein [Bacteroides sp.]